jgi:hypothetical protein
VPSTGGEGIPFATGHALSDGQATHWLLRLSDGTVLTLTTGRDAGPASNSVVTALTEPGTTDA